MSDLCQFKDICYLGWSVEVTYHTERQQCGGECFRVDIAITEIYDDPALYDLEKGRAQLNFTHKLDLSHK